MYITNLEEVVPLLRSKLKDYLIKMLDISPDAKKICCFAHEEKSPSMVFNPKTNFETVKCFGCGAHYDIFSAAAELENLPVAGPDWVTQTIPHLCEVLGIETKLGEPSPLDKERARLHKLGQDISDILSESGDPTGYIASRNWLNDHLVIGTIDADELIEKLLGLGWSSTDISSSLLIRTSHQEFIGSNKVTFVIKDEIGRCLGFQSRNLDEGHPKYINTPENLVYNKSKALMGLDVAIKRARKEGLYIVEGPGDLAQLYRLGVTNAVATCGTALTEQHLQRLKSLGVNKIYLCFDWDNAGVIATQRVFKDVFTKNPGCSAFVVLAPNNSNATDIDEFLHDADSPDAFNELTLQPAFDWALSMFSDHESVDIICEEMVPIIANEPTAVKREILIKSLSDKFGISYNSILTDVMALRDNKFKEFSDRLKASAEEYVKDVETDPTNVYAALAQHEARVEKLHKDLDRNSIGVNYQVSRWRGIQEERQLAAEEGSPVAFKMNFYRQIAERAFNGGQNYTSGCLVYVGGRANSGKTATVTAIGLDVAMSDPDAIVIFHYTDDSYRQVEPRMKTNIARMLYPTGRRMNIGIANNPIQTIEPDDDYMWKLHDEASDKFMELIAEERIVILDAEDGSTLSVLEKNLRFYRQRYPNKKILMICDKVYCHLLMATLDEKACKLLETPKAHKATAYLEREGANAARAEKIYGMIQVQKTYESKQWTISSQAA